MHANNAMLHSDIAMWYNLSSLCPVNQRFINVAADFVTKDVSKGRKLAKRSITFKKVPRIFHAIIGQLD